MTRPRWTALDVALVGATLVGAYALKHQYSTGSVDDLGWILRPTAGLVEAVSGRHFSYEAHVGWMSPSRTFVIAKACAGVNFLIVAAVAVVIGFVRDRRTAAGKLLLVAGSAAAAYVATLVANSVRIAIAIPLHDSCGGTFGPVFAARVHLVEGVVVYVTCLCLYYLAARRALRKDTACAL